ncbi:unnamed protein product [Clonostachys chloroleuca]|uniref:Flavodoxin-like domain-containing protein n=1 Tax=Clonostachys chloroleuca TaxID=1926264 RepID=A0AA35LS94_9HYPO|nr:unnamed protein product [Clonostachys chloroleuca]
MNFSNQAAPVGPAVYFSEFNALDLELWEIGVLSLLLTIASAYYISSSNRKNSLGKGVDSFDGQVDFIGRKDIADHSEQSSLDCIVLYRSQTGTAEGFAYQLVNEAQTKLGLHRMAASLEDYQFSSLNSVSRERLLVFILASFGEGEPTDNAVDFPNFITDKDESLSGLEHTERPLKNLRYASFGLGNNTYQYFNRVARDADRALQALGAIRLGPAGEGDDGAGTMDEEFLSWKELMWSACKGQMGFSEHQATYKPMFPMVECDLSADSPEVYRGEPNELHLQGQPELCQIHARNPFIAPAVQSRELFSNTERNCLHIEIDISGTQLSYQTGDHVAAWVSNPNQEIDRFLRILGLDSKRHMVVHMGSGALTSKLPIAPFAPDANLKAEMTKLGSDKD